MQVSHTVYIDTVGGRTTYETEMRRAVPVTGGRTTYETEMRRAVPVTGI